MSKLNLADIITDDQDPEEIFEILELLGIFIGKFAYQFLGQGNYGSVYKALHKPSGELVAVKIINFTGEIGEMDNLKREIMILQECQNSYIVRYFGSYCKDQSIWLIIEYCTAGSVIDLVRITKKQLNECEISCILLSTLKGLQYLHENRKIHRDIKAGNILLDHKGNAKLADFGVSAQLNHSLGYKDSCIGTPFWMSPEVIKHSKYNQKTDIWSLGITAIELAEGSPPYSHLHPFRAMFAIQNKPPQGLTEPSKWSSEFNNFVKTCLQYDPQNRPTAQQLQADPFIQKYINRQGILSELVLNSMDQIERYRIDQANENQEKEGTMNSQNQCGTFIEKEDNFFHKNNKTFLQEEENNFSINGDTMVVLDENFDIQNYKPEEEEKDFVRSAREMNSMLPDFKSQQSSSVSNPPQLNQFSQPNIQKAKPKSDIQQIDNKELSMELFQILQKNDNVVLDELSLVELEKRKRELEFQMQEKIRFINQLYTPQIEKCKQLIRKLSINEKPQPKSNQNHAKQRFICHDLRKVYPLLEDNKNQEKPINIQNQQIKKQQQNDNSNNQRKNENGGLMDKLINLPFNFQVDEQMIQKLRNLELQIPENSKHLKKQLPFVFIPNAEQKQEKMTQSSNLQNNQRKNQKIDKKQPGTGELGSKHSSQNM